MSYLGIAGKHLEADAKLRSATINGSHLAPAKNGHSERSEEPAFLSCHKQQFLRIAQDDRSDAVKSDYSNWKPATAERQPGFSLIELLIVLVILLTVSGIIFTVIFQMAMSQGSVINRTEMHGGVRAATEFLQQEIGQAGRVASPALVTAPATFTAAVAGDALSHSPAVNNVAGLFPGEMVILGPETGVACPGVAPLFCGGRENMTLTGVAPITNVNPTAGTITGIFQDAHAIGEGVSVQGTFPAGIVPITGSTVLTWSTATSLPVVQVLSAGVVAPAVVATPGSSATVLKMFGDINGDGRMVYIEYFCDTSTVPGTFSRRVIDFNTVVAKTIANFPWVPLLTNLLVNPGGTACFAYQTKTVKNDTYVTDVAVTLTVRTQNKDPQTGAYQNETKALLNVSPRNVYEAWQMASLPGGTTIRLQPMPQSIVNLLNP